MGKRRKSTNGSRRVTGGATQLREALNGTPFCRKRGIEVWRFFGQGDVAKLLLSGEDL